jgi:hypothetical protein
MRMKDASEAPVPCHSVAGLFEPTLPYCSDPYLTRTHLGLIFYLLFFYLRVAFDYDPGQLVISSLDTRALVLGWRREGA